MQQSMMRTLSSLRWRLSLAYTLLLLVLLGVLGAVQYVVLRQSLISARVSTLSGDVVAAQRAASRITAATGTERTAKRFAQLTTTISGQTVVVVVYSHELVAVADAGLSSGQSAPALTTSDLDQALLGSQSPARVLTQGGTRYLAVAFPITPGKRSSTAVVELASSMTEIDSVLRRGLVFDLVGSLLALLAALALGLAVSSGALRPLGRLRATAAELAHGDLAARSRLPHRDDEIGDLGRTLDEMAERIEAAFAARAESEARMRRFIADASHELRTPVTSLKGYIDVMQRGAGTDAAELARILPSMSREAERMRGLVLDLLSLARMDSEQPVTLAPVDVNTLIGRLLDEGVQGMPTTLVRDLDGTGAMASADAAALTTVLRNLLINACKYAPGAAQRWSTRTGPGAVEIRVADSGPGIATQDLAHIFERFYRGEKARGREEGGSGLGLSIVDALVRAQGGEVRAESVEGQGTTFVVRLHSASTAV